DAIVTFGYGRRGAIGVNLPLIDGQNIFSGEIGCNACHAFGSTSVSVDLDQLTVRATALDMFQASLIEASPPSPIVGSPPRSPKFPISKFTPIGYIEDQLEIKSRNNYRDNFRWEFSDRITIAFADVWNGDVNLERQLLHSKSENPRLENVEVVTALAA